MAPITSKDVEAQLAEDAYGTTKPAKGVEDEHDDSHADQAGLSWRTPGAGIVRDIKRTLLTNYFKEITSINQKVRHLGFYVLDFRSCGTVFFYMCSNAAPIYAYCAVISYFCDWRR